MYQLYVMRIFLSFLRNEYFVSRSLLFHSIFFLFISCGAATRFWVMASLYRALGSHTLNARNSVWLLWTCDQPETETSDNTRQSQETNIDALAGCEPAIPSSERSQTQALYVPYDHWNHHFHSLIFILSFLLFLLFFSCVRESSKLHSNSIFADVNCSGMEMSLVCLSNKLTGHTNKTIFTRSDRCIRVCLCLAVSAEVLLTQFNTIITLATLTLCIACWLAAV